MQVRFLRRTQLGGITYAPGQIAEISGDVAQEGEKVGALKIMSLTLPRPLEAVNYTYDRGSVMIRFDETAGKTTAGTGAAFTMDTSLSYEGSPTVRVVSGAGQFAEIGQIGLPSRKLSGVIAIPMYVRDWTKLHSIVLFVGTASYAAAFKAQPYFAAVPNASYQHNGWHIIYFSPTYTAGSEGVWAVEAGAPAWGPSGTDFTQAKIRVTPLSGQIADVNFAAIITDAKALAKLNLFIDDGWVESYTVAHKYCAPRRVNVNYGIISDKVGEANYVTERMLLDMYDSGYADFATHAVRIWGTDPNDDVKAELLRSRAWLRDRGWDRAADYIVYPAGAYDSNLIAWAQDQGFVGARTVNRSNTGTALGLSQLWHSPTSLNMISGTSLNDAKDRLTKLIQCGMTMFTVGHRFAASADPSLTWAVADFEGFIDEVIAERAAGRLEDTLISEWLTNVQPV